VPRYRKTAGERRAQEDRRCRLEERIGDFHHPAHQRQAIDRRQHDHEDRRRQRQIARYRVVFERLRPVVQQVRDVGKPERQRLGREQFGHQLQESRERKSRQRQHGADGGGDADENGHRVGVGQANEEIGEGDEGEEDRAHGISARRTDLTP